MKLALLLFSFLVIVHILNYEVCGAEVNKASARVDILEERGQQLYQLLFAVVVKDKVLLVFDNLVPLFESLVPVLAAHVCFEFAEVAAGNVDQIVLVHASWLRLVVIARRWVGCLLRQ